MPPAAPLSISRSVTAVILTPIFAIMQRLMLSLSSRNSLFSWRTSASSPWIEISLSSRRWKKDETDCDGIDCADMKLAPNASVLACSDCCCSPAAAASAYDI
jgi:hypothetical protein